tara:strand:+ start:3677 stop:4108 length:432 start_codon:yes stop_codon:yes gene_type:complete
VKKKFIASSKDKKDWMHFTKQMGNIHPKDVDIFEKKTQNNKAQKLDLHGFSLTEANKIVKKFIIESFDKGYRKLIIVTGKGLRSKSYDDPYSSKKLSVLKYSVPEYINSNKDLLSKIRSISKADLKDGGEGAIYIFLKNKNKF